MTISTSVFIENSWKGCISSWSIHACSKIPEAPVSVRKQLALTFQVERKLVATFDRPRKIARLKGGLRLPDLPPARTTKPSQPPRSQGRSRRIQGELRDGLVLLREARFQSVDGKRAAWLQIIKCKIEGESNSDDRDKTCIPAFLQHVGGLRVDTYISS